VLPECTAPGQGQHPNPEGPQPAAGKPPPPAASQPARGAAKARPARRTGTAARVARQPLSTPASAVAAAGQPRSRGVVAGHCLLACRPARSGRAARRPRRAAQRRHHRPAAARATHPRVPGMPSRTQIQMRDIPGFVDTRYQLLQLKPNNRNHWISFAVGHHLDNNYEVAVQVRPRSGGRHHDDHTTAMPRTLAAAAGPGDHRSGARVRLLGARPSGRRRRSSPRTPASCLGDPQVINAYEGTQEEGVPASEAYEHSELLLYKAMVLQVGGGGGAAGGALPALQADSSRLAAHPTSHSSPANACLATAAASGECHKSASPRGGAAASGHGASAGGAVGACRSCARTAKPARGQAAVA